MKKYIANIITGSRIVFSLPLLFFSLSSPWFYILYLLCGFTDMIDGAIARGAGAVSKFGARLDTAADFIFMLACAVKMLPRLSLPIWLWGFIIAIALIKIFNIALALIRRKKAIAIHSILNKITGFALFLFPFSLTFIKTVYTVTAICALASIAAIEEAYYAAKGHEIL